MGGGGGGGGVMGVMEVLRIYCIPLRDTFYLSKCMIFLVGQLKTHILLTHIGSTYSLTPLLRPLFLSASATIGTMHMNIFLISTLYQ